MKKSNFILFFIIIIILLLVIFDSSCSGEKNLKKDYVSTKAHIGCVNYCSQIRLL
jgi:hypothetical protein